MGSKSKSSSQQNTTSQDFSAVLEDDAINLAGAKGNSVVIERIDSETVAEAFDFGGDVLNANVEVIDEAFDFGGRALDFVEGSDERNANIINAATTGIRQLSEKVVEGLFADRVNARQSDENALLETLGKYSTAIFLGSAAAAAYAFSRK